MKIFKKVVYTLVLIVVLLGAPMLSRIITNLGNYSTLDPDGAFVWISIRHTFQAVLILLCMILASKIFKLNFNLGLGNKEVGIKYLKRFMLIFFGYTVVVFGITYLVGNFSPFQFPMNTRNIVGYLGFQLLLSGPSEEFIFRAFSITLFTALIAHKRIDKNLSYANIFAAVVFGLAHVAISFSPFGLSYALPQVFLAIGLGLFYGDCYEKSKSVIYPMIMHSFTNVLMVGITILITMLS